MQDAGNGRGGADAGYSDPWGNPQPVQETGNDHNRSRTDIRSGDPWGNPQPAQEARNSSDRTDAPISGPGGSADSDSMFEDEKTVKLKRVPDKILILIPEGGEQIPLECTVHSGMTIGRRATCDICLADDKSVSGLHCTIIVRGDALFVKDENSSNGTFLNNVKLTEEQTIKSGDVLEIGRRKFQVQIK